MIDIELENFSRAGEHEPIRLKVQVVPPEGSTLFIHRSLMPGTYFEPGDVPPRFDPGDDGQLYVETIVGKAIHTLGPAGHQICVDFAIVTYEDGTCD